MWVLIENVNPMDVCFIASVNSHTKKNLAFVTKMFSEVLFDFKRVFDSISVFSK